MNKPFFEERNSGISLIGDLAWGTSFCYFYQTLDEQMDVLVPYFKAGLENDEYCVWVNSETPVASLYKILEDKIPDFNVYRDNRQIEIIPRRRWYTAGKNPADVILAKLDDAVLHGFDGLRLMINPTFADNKENHDTGIFVEIETISRYNIIALFGYPRGRFDAGSLMEAMKNYPFALVRNANKLEVIESSGARIIKGAMVRNEERFHSLFSHMSEGFAHHRIVLDENGIPCNYVFLEVNDAFEKLVGLSSKDILGKKVTQVLPGIEKDSTDWIGRYGKVALTGQPAHFDSYSDPLKKWYSVSAFSTQKGFFSVVFTDITERKDADQSLKESEERFRAIAEISMIMLSVSRVSDGKILFANQAYADAFGFKLDGIIGQKGENFYSNATDRARLVETLTRQGFVKDYEIQVKKSDGTPFWISTSVRQVNYAGESALLASSIDITNRKNAEAEVLHLASFSELNPNPILELDVTGKVVYANPAAIMRFPDIFDDRKEHPFLVGLREIVKAGTTHQVTRDIEVGEFWYEQVLAYAEPSNSYRLYVRDITNRKKAEEGLKQRTNELVASNKELEAFSYSVSHDLRAPLRSMDGFSNALLEDYTDKLDDQGKKYLKYIQDSSNLMGQLIDDLLKLSRVTRSEMNYQPVDLSALANQIIDDLRKIEPDRQVTVNITPDLIAYGDRNLLRVVLENLLGNAWKFTGKTDSPKIEMGIIKQNKGKRSFFVRDNGVGFDMKYVDKLFNPFQRLHKASEFPGTGIGLATVQRIIHRHGGEVRAESEIGRKTTVYFTLG